MKPSFLLVMKVLKRGWIKWKAVICVSFLGLMNIPDVDKAITNVTCIEG